MIEVQTDHGVVEFPDGTSNSDIEKSLSVFKGSVGDFIRQPDFDTTIDPELAGNKLLAQFGKTPIQSPSFEESKQQSSFPIPTLEPGDSGLSLENISKVSGIPESKLALGGVPEVQGLSEWAYGLGNLGINLVNFLKSPEGGATLGIGGMGPAARRLLGAAFGERMAEHDLPEAVQQLGTVWDTGTPFEKKQAALNALSTAAFAGGGLAGAALPGEIIPEKGTPDATQERQIQRDVQVQREGDGQVGPSPESRTSSELRGTEEVPKEEVKPEVASLGPEGVGGKDLLGNPLGTKYHATPEDWAKWQELSKIRSDAREAKDVKTMFEVSPQLEALKNKYGGNVPEPPKQSPPAAPPSPTPQSPTESGAPGASQLGGGAAEAGEIQQQGYRQPGDPLLHGVRQETLEEQASKGQVAPVLPGEGHSPQQLIARGRELKAQGADPYQVVANVIKNGGRLNYDDAAIIRAHSEDLLKEADRTYRENGPDSPEHEKAWEAYNAWVHQTKTIVGTMWSDIGKSMQGEVDLDTGSFIGMRKAIEEVTGKKPDKATTDEIVKKSDEIETAKTGTQKAKNEVKDQINEKLKESDDYTPEEKANLDALRKKAEDWPDEVARKKKLWQSLKPGPEKDLAKTDYERERDAFHSVVKTLREADARQAKIENRKRVEQAQRNLDVARIEEARKQEALDSASKAVRDAATERAKQERVKGPDEAKRQKELNKIEDERNQKALDAASKAVRDAAKRRAEAERKLQANPQERVWSVVRKYMDVGVDDLNDLIAKTSVETGLSPNQVAHWIGYEGRRGISKAATEQGAATRMEGETRAQSIRRAMDDLWLKQKREGQLRASAQRWILQQQYPMWKTAIGKIPLAFFKLKILGHGMVALGTHAPTLFFRPQYWDTYFSAYKTMGHMMLNPAFHEMMMQNLQRRPTFSLFKRAGLQNDPHTFEDYSTPLMTKLAGSWLGGLGDRGYSVLKVLRQDMAERAWEKLPETMKSDEMAKQIAVAVNHMTGVTEAMAPKGSNLVLFAPRLWASRFAWFGDAFKAAWNASDWKNLSPEEKYFAKQQLYEKGTVVGVMTGMLLANQALLQASGSKQKINFTDPMQSDWLKFKAAGQTITYGNPFLTLLRFPARLYQLSASTGRKGRSRTTTTPDEDFGKIALEYARSQESPFAGTLGDIALFRSDWQGRPLPHSNRPVPIRLRRQGVQPYKWGEYAREQIAPIPFEEFLRDSFHAQGMNEQQSNQALENFKTIVKVGAMTLTGARINRDWTLENQPVAPAK